MMERKLGGVFPGAVLAQERFEGIPDVFFLLDLNRLKIRRLDLRKKRDHAAAVIARAERLDFTVAEKIRGLGELLGRLQSGFVVRLEIVAVGAMEHVNIPKGGMVKMVDDLQSLDIAC